MTDLKRYRLDCADGEWTPYDEAARALLQARADAGAVPVMDGRVSDHLNAVIAEFAANLAADGFYMPALATLLRLQADTYADLFPDDANGGMTDEDRAAWMDMHLPQA